MNWLMLAGVLSLALLLLLFRAFSGRGGKTVRVSYQKQNFLFSPEERFFFAALQQAAGENYEIFGKIRFGDLVSPRNGGSRDNQPIDLGAIGEQPVAFVLCNKDDLSVACAVQLQEHFLAGRKSSEHADPLKPICQAAGLPLVRFEASPLYDSREIREAIAAAVRKEPLFFLESDGRKEPSISGLENLEL